MGCWRVCAVYGVTSARGSTHRGVYRTDSRRDFLRLLAPSITMQLRKDGVESIRKRCAATLSRIARFDRGMRGGRDFDRIGIATP